MLARRTLLRLALLPLATAVGRAAEPDSSEMELTLSSGRTLRITKPSFRRFLKKNYYYEVIDRRNDDFPAPAGHIWLGQKWITAAYPIDKLASIPAGFSGNDIVLRRTDPKGSRTVFKISGLGPEAISGELARIRADIEFYPRNLSSIRAKTSIDGLQYMLNIGANMVDQLTISRDALQVKLKDGAETFEVRNLKDASFRYKGGNYCTTYSENESSLPFLRNGSSRTIEIRDIASYEMGPKGIGISLRNKEGELGQIEKERAKTIWLVGALRGDFGSFPANACFRLSDIRAFKFV
jgi:hypothetical protein